MTGAIAAATQRCAPARPAPARASAHRTLKPGRLVQRDRSASRTAIQALKTQSWPVTGLVLRRPPAVRKKELASDGGPTSIMIFFFFFFFSCRPARRSCAASRQQPLAGKSSGWPVLDIGTYRREVKQQPSQRQAATGGDGQVLD